MEQTDVRNAHEREIRKLLQSVAVAGSDLDYEEIAQLVEYRPDDAPALQRMEACFAIAFHLGDFNQFKSALHYARQCTALAEKYGKSDKQAKAYFIYGSTLFHLDRFEEAIQVLFKGLELNEERFQFRILLRLAGIYMDIGELETANLYLQRAAVLKEKTDPVQFIDYNLSMINFLMMRGEYEKARLYGMASIKLCAELDSTHKLGFVYNALGHLAFDRGHYEEGIEYALKGKEICEAIHYEARVGEAEYILAECHERTGELEVAARFFEQACEKAEKYRLHLWFECFEGRYRVYDKLRDLERMDALVAEMLSFENEFFAYENTGRLKHLVDEQNNRIRQLEAQRLELEQNNRQLEQKNEELREFAYIVSHDLRQPLRNMSSFLNLLEKKYLATEQTELVHSAQHVKESSNRLYEMLRSPNEFVSLNEQQLYESEIRLPDLCKQVFEAVRKARPQLDIQLDYKGAECILANEKLLRMLLENLFLFSANRQIDDKVEIGIEAGQGQQGELLFSYRDNGNKISGRSGKKQFSLIGQVEAGFEDGSGLGLAIVNKIVQLYRGELAFAGDNLISFGFKQEMTD